LSASTLSTLALGLGPDGHSVSICTTAQSETALHDWENFCTNGGGPIVVGAVQGAFGMWTVTLLVHPGIVTTHLIGGFVTTALLTWSKRLWVFCFSFNG
jgi:hypothetical protein